MPLNLQRLIVKIESFDAIVVKQVDFISENSRFLFEMTTFSPLASYTKEITTGVAYVIRFSENCTKSVAEFSRGA